MERSKAELYLLLPLLFPLILGVLQHLFLPQVEEVGGIGVELKCFLVVIPTETDTKNYTGAQMSLYRNVYEVESIHCLCLGRMTR